ARSVGPTDSSFARLVSLAAHDLRTPLATIHGFAQTLVRMGVVGEPEQRYLEMIDAAADQLAELLDEVGLAARIEGGRYEPNLQQPPPMREHLEAAVENDDPSEVRRLLADVPFTAEQRRHVTGLLDAWEEGRP